MMDGGARDIFRKVDKGLRYFAEWICYTLGHIHPANLDKNILPRAHSYKEFAAKTRLSNYRTHIHKAISPQRRGLRRD
jgi:hypothetical protein